LKKDKNILVTGSHRSGSTWVGYVIAKAENIRYVHEPFNIGIKNNNSPFKHWFEHLNGTSINHQKQATHYLNSFYVVFHIHTFRSAFKIRSLKGVRSFLTDLKKRLTSRTIVKDPIAIMSAEWIYENYNWNIVTLIRHPAAFVASLKVKNWEFDFNNFLQQNLLMDNYLKNYSVLIEDYTKNKKDIIDQGILLWNIIHDVIYYYKEKYGENWYFVKHEDLSKNPIPEFEKMFRYLNLKANNVVEDYINKTTTSKENSSYNRNSVENLKTWKNRLTTEEIYRIKEGTKNIWTRFYTENDW